VKHHINEVDSIGEGKTSLLGFIWSIRVFIIINDMAGRLGRPMSMMGTGERQWMLRGNPTHGNEVLSQSPRASSQNEGFSESHVLIREFRG